MSDIILKLPGGTFSLSVDAGGGSISSNLHFESLEEFVEAGSDEPGERPNELIHRNIGGGTFDPGDVNLRKNSQRCDILASGTAAFDAHPCTA